MLGPLTYGVLSQVTAVSSNWWQSGGATGAVRVYQPIGAASLAASYFDYTGNRDAAPGTAPTWDAINGWTFAAASLQYLTTGLTPANDAYTYIVRFGGSPANGEVLFGFLDSSKRAYIQPNASSTVTYANSATGVTVAPALSSGVLAVNATDGYRNGTSETSAIGDWGAGTTQEIYIGALRRSGSITNYLSGTIQAIAIYDNSLTDAQVSAVSTAMAAL